VGEPVGQIDWILRLPGKGREERVSRMVKGKPVSGEKGADVGAVIENGARKKNATYKTGSTKSRPPHGATGSP